MKEMNTNAFEGTKCQTRSVGRALARDPELARHNASVSSNRVIAGSLMSAGFLSSGC